MTIKKLIKLLQKENQNRHVTLSSDSEGNNFALLEEGFGEYEFIRGGKSIKVIVLFPEDEYLEDKNLRIRREDDPINYIMR